MHVRYDHVTVDGEPAPGLIAVVVLWVVNNYEALHRAGTGVYFYIPKLQTPQEALILEKLLARMEGIIGVPAGTMKIKVLYEEGNAGRSLAAIAWVLRRRLLGTNVGRWDYLGSLIEIWKDDPKGVFPGSADDRHGVAQHDRLSALQRAADADGRHEEWRAQHGGPHRRHGGRDDLSVQRSVRSLAVQPARAAGHGGGQIARTPTGFDVHTGGAACGRSAARHWTTFLPAGSRHGSTMPIGKAGSPVRNRPTWPRAIRPCAPLWRSSSPCSMHRCRRST